MSQLQFPTNKTITGPWILNREDLEDLNDTLETIASHLESDLTEEIKQTLISNTNNNNLNPEELLSAIEREKSKYKYYKQEKDIKLISTDGKILRDGNMKGLLKDNNIENLKPRDIYVNFAYGYHNQLKMTISGGYTNELEYDINCFDHKVSSEIKYEIEKWIEKRAPNKLLQYWSGYGWIIAWICLCLSIMMIFYILDKTYTNYNEILIQESHSILEKGVDSTNVYSALELVLKLNSGYTSKEFIPKEKPKEPIFYRIIFLLQFILWIAIISPKTTIGIGKRKFRYKFYKFWIKLVTITIPTFLIVIPFWEKIVNWLY